MLNDWDEFVSPYGERGKKWFGYGRWVAVVEDCHTHSRLPKWQVWVGSDPFVDGMFPYGNLWSASMYVGAQSEAYKRAEMLARSIVMFARHDARGGV